jgi:hypothetical protein
MYLFCMYVSYAQALYTLCSMLESDGCGLIALLFNALHKQSADQPHFEQVYPLQLSLLRLHPQCYIRFFLRCLRADATSLVFSRLTIQLRITSAESIMTSTPFLSWPIASIIKAGNKLLCFLTRSRINVH